MKHEYKDFSNQIGINGLIATIAQAYQKVNAHKNYYFVEHVIDESGNQILSILWGKPYCNVHAGSPQGDEYIKGIIETIIREASVEGFNFLETLDSQISALVCYEKYTITSPDPEVPAIYTGNNMVLALKTAYEYVEKNRMCYVQVGAFNLMRRADDNSFILGINIHKYHESFAQLVTHIGEYYHD